MAQRDALLALEKKMKALSLAKSGVEYETIAKECGYNSRQAAHKAVKSALKATIKPAADEVRIMQLTRLDAMLKAVWPGVLVGNEKAIDRALRIEERRAKLLGLDAPEKHETDITAVVAEANVTGMSEDERNARITAIFDAARARRIGSPAETPLLDAGSEKPPADGSVL